MIIVPYGRKIWRHATLAYGKIAKLKSVNFFQLSDEAIRQNMITIT